MSLFGVLGVVFIVLKLIGVIAWSWWLVLLPFYIIPVIWIVFFGGFLMIASVVSPTRFRRY